MEGNAEPQKQATPTVYAYFVVLMALAIIPEKLASTPLKFVYKNELHLDAEAAAMLIAIITIPGYFAFLFGMCRDRFSPFKLGDRGYLILCGGLLTAVFAAIAEAPLTLATLAAGLFVVTASQTLVRAAYQALMRAVSEVRLMSGRMSTTYQFMVTAVPMGATVAGGWLTDNQISWRTILLGVAAGYLGLAIFGRLRPVAIFDGLPTPARTTNQGFWRDVKALARRKPFWIAAAIWGLWAFSPGANTPIYYYMTTTLGLSQREYSTYDGLTTLTLVPTVLLFGLLIKRFSLRPLLLIATAVAIPQMLPLMLIHSAPGAYAAATFMGLTGGLANAAYWSLVIRACPGAMAGAGMLMAISFGHIAVNGSDILGGWIFKQWGFSGCAWVTTAAYLLLIPLVLAIPRALVAPADGEPTPADRS